MKPTVNWKTALKADPTEWLLEPQDPGVRYLALRDIAGAGEKVVKEARRIAHREGPVARILAEMNPEGYWLSPGHVYGNKCRGTVWSLISLGQLGASIEEDERIGKACSYLLANALAEGGQFSSNGQPEGTFDCLQGNLLTALMDMGCRDKRLETAYEWTARTVTGEGLSGVVTAGSSVSSRGRADSFHFYKYKSGPRFACRSNKYQPCAWGGVKILTALSRWPAEWRTPLIERAIATGVEYFFKVDPASAAFPGDNAATPDTKWRSFHFPLFWAADILQVAEVLIALGFGGDSRLANTLEMIRQKQDEHGCWPLEVDPYRNRMWLNYGSRAKPNKWVTLRALRVLEKAAKQAEGI